MGRVNSVSYITESGPANARLSVESARSLDDETSCQVDHQNKSRRIACDVWIACMCLTTCSKHGQDLLADSYDGQSVRSS